VAHQLKLAAKFEGMDKIWNIDAKVGTQASEPNMPDDVALVQLLINISLRNAGSGSKISPAVPGCRTPPLITGTMDYPTGFWIYFTQVEVAGAKADGNLTPSGKHPVFDRLIVRMNYYASMSNRIEWADLPNNLLCPPMLRIKLLAPAR
jgi:hypothetical protein